ncbi:hypothetical protein L6452_21960 [Arctium lappa]|uniref:Uncharacterized protein n=1 Tax=Arctium lappa TaxID=4217 RepID=A0ACB9AXM0_ARCLA|nr:hypothetical protein L6452_21960 [Arctium lappa]
MDTCLQQGRTHVFSKDGHRSSARYKALKIKKSLVAEEIFGLLKTERSSALKTEGSSALKTKKSSASEDVFGRRRLRPNRSSAEEVFGS